METDLKFLSCIDEDRVPERDTQCLTCGVVFFVSPHTEEGLYLGNDKVLRLECPSCNARENKVGLCHICFDSFVEVEFYFPFDICKACVERRKHCFCGRDDHRTQFGTDQMQPGMYANTCNWERMKGKWSPEYNSLTRHVRYYFQEP